MIDVLELRKSYGPVKALDGISFMAKPGEVLGFLGPNGAGKSTTMRILAGFIAPTSGTASISGIAINDSSRDARRNIGYLPEHAPAYEEMVVSDFLTWSAYLKGVKTREVETAISKSIERCGLGDMAKRRIGTLSKGYRQRVGLAQALVHQPDVLILDEPLSGLDPNQVADMRTVIRQEGEIRTVLFSSHILSDVQAIADRIIVINKGVIVADRNLQKMGHANEDQSFLIRLSGVSFSEVNQHVTQLASVDQVKLKTETAFETEFELLSTPGFDCRSDVLALISSRGWTLLQLEVMKDDLEAVFRDVTRGER